MSIPFQFFSKFLVSLSVAMIGGATLGHLEGLPNAQGQAQTPAGQAEKPPPPAIPFATTGYYRTTIAQDVTDIYYPIAGNTQKPVRNLPIALFLPGALVDKLQYSRFATLLARYGFAVVVPSHVRSLPEFGIQSGELAEARQIPTVLAFMQAENRNPSSPLAGHLNPQKLALLGHSHGGFVGLSALADQCLPLFCTPPFTRPQAVVAGVFYGVNSRNPMTGNYYPTANAGIPVALIQGRIDGIATLEEANETYQRIQDRPKALIVIRGANHYGITNLNNPRGARPDQTAPTLRQPEAIQAIAQWSGYFLRAHVLNDAAAWNYIYHQGDAQDPLVEVIHP